MQRSALRVMDVFKGFDTERPDGRISRSEFKRGLVALQFEVPEKYLDELFDSFDPDGSGELEVNEFTKMLRGHFDENAPPPPAGFTPPPPPVVAPSKPNRPDEPLAPKGVGVGVADGEGANYYPAYKIGSRPPNASARAAEGADRSKAAQLMEYYKGDQKGTKDGAGGAKATPPLEGGWGWLGGGTTTALASVPPKPISTGLSNPSKRPATFLTAVLIDTGVAPAAKPPPFAGGSSLPFTQPPMLIKEARTAAQPYSKIRENYSWDATWIRENNLMVDLGRGTMRPATVRLSLYEEPDLAAATRSMVPSLFVSPTMRSGAAHRKPPRPDPIELASALVCVDGTPGGPPMEVLLKGRKLLGKDYKVKFNVDVSIW
jgi:hypothetical protein